MKLIVRVALQAALLVVATNGFAFCPHTVSLQYTRSLACSASSSRCSATPWHATVRGGTETGGEATGNTPTEWERGFSFSVAGLLFPYHLGVASVLKEQGLLRRGTPLSGASGGAIAALIIAMDQDLELYLDSIQEAYTKCRAGGTARYRLAELLREELNEILPEDAHTRVNSWEGGVEIGIMKLVPMPQAEMVRTFFSKKDVIEAVLASCHIPLWVSGSAFSSFRGAAALDGYFANMESFGCPETEARATVCVSPFAAWQVFGNTGSFSDALVKLGATIEKVTSESSDQSEVSASVSSEEKGRSQTPLRGQDDSGFFRSVASRTATLSKNAVTAVTGVLKRRSDRSDPTQLAGERSMEQRGGRNGKIGGRGGVKGDDPVVCFGSVVISPELQPEQKRGLAAACVPTALDLTDDDEFVRRLYLEGRSDAQVWIQRSSAPS